MNQPRGWVKGLAALVATAAAATAGCGSNGPTSDPVPLEFVPVAGTVTLDGKPLPGVEVRLVAADQTFASGSTNAAGRYEMRFDSTTPGVPTGPKRVEIRRVTAGTADGNRAVHESDVTAGYKLESSDRVMVTKPLEGLDFRLVTKPSGS